ncbi:hypothetical protein [Nocardia asiatica]|uniref:hypothetical protein n=1 Tax=Nocardia asiatica TaxID=209252 RepID=UPI0024558E25|nr:hypothetical protein [Nocardia asiatica]
MSDRPEPEIALPDIQRISEGLRALGAAAPAIMEAVDRALDPIRQAAAEAMAVIRERGIDPRGFPEPVPEWLMGQAGGTPE